MTHGSRVYTNILILIAILFMLLLLIDRYYWAQISQWREDQATNLWLGLTSVISNLPVGLISSRKIPNPNGMPLLGIFLSALPNLLSISFFLGTLQMILIALLGWKAFGRKWQYLLLATMPALASVALRSSSVEFWNQYTITLLNIFFLFWVVRYLENASLWTLPPIAILILLAPALYLAGIVNAIVMTLITIGVLFYKRPDRDGFWLISVIILLLVLSSALLTWLPYFRSVGLEQIIRDIQIEPAQAGTVPWAFKHADPRILSATSRTLLAIADRIYFLQIAFTFLAFLYLFWSTVFRKRSLETYADTSPRYIAILCRSEE